MIIDLEKTYKSRDGYVTIRRIEAEIFSYRYFTHCMDCNFCHDSCCSYGAEIDAATVHNLEAHAEALTALTGLPRSEWLTEEYAEDKTVRGGRYTRTQVKNDQCVFLNRSGRGCLIHTYCLQNGLDYHDFKPLICWLFPLTYIQDLLRPALEITDHSLICRDQGPSVYWGCRAELAYYFSPALVEELDRLEAGQAFPDRGY